MEDKIIKDYIINSIEKRFNLKFLNHETKSSDYQSRELFYFSDYQSQNVQYLFDIYTYKLNPDKIEELDNRLSFTLVSENPLSNEFILMHFNKIGFNLEFKKAIELFANLMKKFKFYDNFVLKNNITPFKSRKENRKYLYILDSSFVFATAYYNDSIKEKNEGKLAESSRIEIQTSTNSSKSKEKHFFSVKLKLPLTFKQKIRHLYTGNENELFFEELITPIMHKFLINSLIRKKIISKKDSCNLTFEELLELKKILEIVNI